MKHFCTGGMSWRAFFERLYRGYRNHAVADSAATLSYYFVFSLFPFLFFLATLTAYVPYAQVAADELLARAHAVLPAAAMDVIDAHVRGLVGNARPRLLTLGFVITLYSASRGVDGVRKALNRAHGVQESRSLWRTELLALGMTVGGAVVVLVAIGLLVAGSGAGLWLAHRLRIDEQYAIALRWIRWPVTAAVVMGCAAIAYHLLPDVERPFQLITPGSVLGTLVWFAAVLGFGAYASHFGSYNVTYGSIGGVMLLLTWFYISGLIFLMGGEANAILCSPGGTSARSYAGRAT